MRRSLLRWLVACVGRAFGPHPRPSAGFYALVTPALLPRRLCGTYPPSYNLTFLSSQNVLLVTLVTNTERRHPGFEAMVFQLPRMSSKGQPRRGQASGPRLMLRLSWLWSVWCPGRSLREAGQLLRALSLPGSLVLTPSPLPFLSGCGGYLHAAQGTFSSPYYPGHYPPNINCTWNIEVGAVMGGGRKRLEKGGDKGQGGGGRGGLLQGGRREHDECLRPPLRCKYGGRGRGRFGQHPADPGSHPPPGRRLT